MTNEARKNYLDTIRQIEKLIDILPFSVEKCDLRMANIKQRLYIENNFPENVSSAPYNRADISFEVARLWYQGEKIKAIKQFRAEKNAMLKDAKNALETLLVNMDSIPRIYPAPIAPTVREYIYDPWKTGKYGERMEDWRDIPGRGW